MNDQSIGNRMYELAKKIFPYCRSITGKGVRETIKDLNEYILQNTGKELKVFEVPSGTHVFDWTVPKEWVIREAFIEDSKGHRIIDMKDNNLHVMGYSMPVDMWVSLEELLNYIYTQQDQPDVIPYVTSFYKERVGFCMSQKQKDSLKPGKYHMYIDSELFDGVLNYAELVFPGKSKQEVFFSTYFCHPSMANNECSGPVLATELIKYVDKIKERRFTYRFLFIPETIGSITYLSQNNNLQTLKDHMIAGFNLTCVGDDRDYSIIETRYADTLADKVLNNILKFKTDDNYSRYTFLQRGSDERQYNAPGVELPVVSFCRSKFHEFPEYHTSADNMDIVSPSGFAGSYDVMTKVIQTLEHNYYYKSTVLCEPQLGKRGLYPTSSQKFNKDKKVKIITNFIAYADGRNDLVDISNIIGESTIDIIENITELIDNRLITT